MSVVVPNQFPQQHAARRLAICGEAPGSDEVAWHVCTVCGKGYVPAKSYSGAKCPACGGAAVHTPTPFVGPSGNILNYMLAKVGIARDGCYVGNVARVQPPGNKIELFKWDGEEIQQGLQQLVEELIVYHPHMILCLGNTPLRALRSEKGNISDWRGSLFESAILIAPVKCMATYHPAFLLPSRSPESSGIVEWDMRRLAVELQTDDLVLPKRDIVIAHPDEGWTAQRLVQWCEMQRELRALLSVDIEGGCDWIECIGFATCPEHALVVPLISVDKSSVWSEDDEVVIWQALKGLLEDASVPKIGTNLLYDCFVLAWTYGIVVQPVADDTMLKWHECYCELEKSLAMQTSVLTREPFYKFQRKLAKSL